MKKVIVTTTIYPPTAAIRKFDALEEWQLVVAGDLKTPEDYQLENGIYLSPQMQEDYDKNLSDLLGWNCIQRRNFALLWAHELEADVIAVIDDDNIPYDNWGKNISLNEDMEVNYYETALPCFDPIGATNESQLWHRGYPLELIPSRDYSHREQKTQRFQIQADFWDRDPDVDAICRMIHAPEVNFDPAYFPLASNVIAPFNSQNTFLSKEVLPDYFLFPDVGRMDDIWVSYYVQAKGFKVVFQAPSVYQERNLHNLIDDMKLEYLGYENNLRIVREIVHDPEMILELLSERGIKAWELYRRHFQ